jgi:hypothetical protein
MKKGFWLILVFLLITGCTQSPRNGDSPSDPESGVVEQESGSSTVSAVGFTRAKPIPLGEQATTPEWNIRVKEFLRGADALQIIREDAPDTPEAPTGYEYALVSVEIRCIAIDQRYHSISLGEMYMTGNHFVAYKDGMDEIPAPEFLYKDLYTAESATGWVDAVIPVEEENLMMVYDKYEGEEEVRATLYFELEPGASIAIPKEFAKIKATDLGLTSASPIPLGEMGVSEDWQVQILEVVSGEEALQIIKTESFDGPEAGMDYVLLRLKLKYISTDDLPANLGSMEFPTLDANGNEIYRSDVYPTQPSSRPWLDGTIFPGAEVEGWVSLKYTAGATGRQMLLISDPYSSPNRNSNQRYFSLEK